MMTIVWKAQEHTGVQSLHDTYAFAYRTSNIGEGATFLNRVLSNKMFQHDATGAGLLAEFLASLNHKGQSLMCSDELATIPALHRAAQRAEELLEGQEDEVWHILECDGREYRC